MNLFKGYAASFHRKNRIKDEVARLGAKTIAGKDTLLAISDWLFIQSKNNLNERGEAA